MKPFIGPDSEPFVHDEHASEIERIAVEQGGAALIHETAASMQSDPEVAALMDAQRAICDGFINSAEDEASVLLKAIHHLGKTPDLISGINRRIAALDECGPSPM